MSEDCHDNCQEQTLKVYIIEEQNIKSILDFTGLEICRILNEIVKLTGLLIIVDLLIGYDYCVVSGDVYTLADLSNKIIQIFPESTHSNNWSKSIFIYFVPF